jgi:hypothetical protein
MCLIYSFLAKLINLVRYFSSSEISQTQLSSLIISPRVKISIYIDCNTKGLSSLTQREIFESDSFGGAYFNGYLNLSEFT